MVTSVIQDARINTPLCLLQLNPMEGSIVRDAGSVRDSLRLVL
jgi:hypothetical protein